MKEQGMLYYEYNCYIHISRCHIFLEDVVITKRKKFGTVVTAANCVPKLIPANGREHYLDDERIGFEVYIDAECISITMYDFNEDADNEFARQVIAILARELKKSKREREYEN